MKQRDRVRMSDDEIDAFLHGRHSMSVATVNHDGTIHLVAMWYGFLEGAPAFETYAKSQKVRNLQRDARLTCLVESGDEYDELRGVELVGRGEVVDDRDRLLAAAASVISRYNDLPADQVGAAAEALAHKRVAVKLHVERVVSWDHAKLR